MTKLLFIQASPRGEQSKSIMIAQTYLAALKATNPALEVDVLPLWLMSRRSPVSIASAIGSTASG